MKDLSNAAWRKSWRSKDGECVEVAITPEVIGMRDSKDPTGPVLRFSPASFAAFVDALRRDEF